MLTTYEYLYDTYYGRWYALNIIMLLDRSLLSSPKIFLVNFSNIYNEFIRRVRRTWNNYGTIGFFKATLRFLVYPFFQCVEYRLYQSQITPNYIISGNRYGDVTDKVTFRVVRSNPEADKLEVEGLSFRSYPTPFNNYLKFYRRWLDCGAIAFCTFVDKEFAAICWVIPSKRTQLAIKAPLLHVNYSQHEVFPRGAWVNPKYRGMDLYRYNWVNRDRYLSQIGITTLRSVIDYSSKIGKDFVEALGQKQYGRARSLKILWFRFWKEYYIK
jgi:hypothetical protein